MFMPNLIRIEASIKLLSSYIDTDWHPLSPDILHAALAKQLPGINMYHFTISVDTETND